MGILQHWRRELYARELSEVMLLGLSTRDYPKARLKAYVAAGYAPNGDNARRDANRGEVKARVTELYRQALEFRDVRAAQVVTRIDRVGRANMREYYEREIDKVSQQPTGRLKLRCILDLPPELSEAIAEVEFDADGDPVKLKLHDKNQANFTLLKYFGSIPDAGGGDHRSVNITNIFAGLSVDDQNALAEALEALPAGQGASGTEAA